MSGTVPPAARPPFPIDALAFDILGTLVDEPAGIRAAIAAAVPGADDNAVAELLATWQQHIATEQQRIVDGQRTFVPSEVLDAEAAHHVVTTAGGDPAAAAALGVAAGQRLGPWPDSLAGLARLAGSYPLIGLSNASRQALLGLNAHAGLRWHQALSAQSASTYKPDPAVYRLAVDIAGCAPDRVLMVAAHAWDLRGAQTAGLRTAYVRRPIGDPPGRADRFDLHAEGLADLADQLGAPPC